MSCVQMRAWMQFGKDFDLARLEESLSSTLDAGRIAESATSSVQPIGQLHWPSNVQPGRLAGLSLAQLSLVHFLRGEWNLASSEAEDAYRSSFPSAGQGAIVGALFRQRAYLSGTGPAPSRSWTRRLGVPPSAGGPNPAGAWIMLLQMIEGFVVLGERQRAAALPWPRARASRHGRGLDLDRAPVSSAPPRVSPLPRPATGRPPSITSRWRRSEADAFPYRLEQLEIRRFRAMMLLDRAAPGDRAIARSLLGEAADLYGRFGMPRHHELTERLLASAT